MQPAAPRTQPMSEPVVVPSCISNAFAAPIESNEQCFVAPGVVYPNSAPISSAQSGDGQVYYSNNLQPAGPYNSFCDVPASSAATASFQGDIFGNHLSSDLSNSLPQLMYNNDPYCESDSAFQGRLDHFGNGCVNGMNNGANACGSGCEYATDHMYAGSNPTAMHLGNEYAPPAVGVDDNMMTANHAVNIMDDGQAVMNSNNDPFAVDFFSNPSGYIEQSHCSQGLPRDFVGCSQINASPARTVRQRSRPPPTMRPPPVPANMNSTNMNMNMNHNNNSTHFNMLRGPNKKRHHEMNHNWTHLDPNSNKVTNNNLMADNDNMMTQTQQVAHQCDGSCSVHVGPITELNRITNTNLYKNHRRDARAANHHSTAMNMISQPPTPQNVMFECSPSTSLGGREASVTMTGSTDAATGDVQNFQISPFSRTMPTQYSLDAPHSPLSANISARTMPTSHTRRQQQQRVNVVQRVPPVPAVALPAKQSAPSIAASVHQMALMAAKAPKAPDHKPIPALIPPMEAIPKDIKIEGGNMAKSEIPPSLDYKVPVGPIPDSPKKRHQCTMCNSHWFETEEALKLHINTHLIMQRTTKKRSGDPDRPWQCEVCNRKFAEKCTLKRHIRIHTNEKPWKCTFCTKAFNQSCSLQAHIRIHTGERPFPCDFCPKRFRQSTHRRQHCKRVHKVEWALKQAESNKMR